MVSNGLNNGENLFGVLLMKDFATCFVYSDIPDFCGCGQVYAFATYRRRDQTIHSLYNGY